MIAGQLMVPEEHFIFSPSPNTYFTVSLCHSCLSHVCFSGWKDTLRKKAGTRKFSTLLKDETAQQDPPAGGNRAKQPQQCNEIFKEDPPLADHAAHEQHNLATRLKQKTSKAKSLFLAAVWTYTCFRQVWTHALSLTFPTEQRQTHYNPFQTDTIQSS